MTIQSITIVAFLLLSLVIETTSFLSTSKSTTTIPERKNIIFCPLCRLNHPIVSPPASRFTKSWSLQAAPESDTNNAPTTSANQNRITIQKSPDEETYIKDALTRKALFRSLPPEALQTLVDAFETTSATPGQVICEQGDVSADDYVYLVGTDSECTVTVDGVQVPEPYGTIAAGSIFGELGVLYKQKRSATISAKSPSTGTVLYRVAGDTFLTILNKPTEKLASMREIDDAINQVEGTNSLYGGDIIPPYKPERAWLWKQYAGTILNISLQTTVLNMLFCLAFTIFAKQVTGDISLFDTTQIDIREILLSVRPDQNNPFIQRLSLIHEIWGYQQTLTTFVLTFFLNQAYGFWKEVYFLARNIQSHLCDFHLLLATNVKRDEDGGLPPASAQLMDDIGQYSRLYHILMWGSVAKRFNILTTPTGLERMESRGLMTLRQLQVLQSLNVPNDQLHSAPLEWMMIRVNQGMANGTLAGDTATKGQFLKQTTLLRGTFSTIEDKLAGRMPLAYAHLVQILVDTYVLTAPLALYSVLGEYSVIAVGILTLSFTGFLNLSKIFLDPLNNENFCENSIFMDLGVLIREANAGSTQWKNSGIKLPL